MLQINYLSPSHILSFSLSSHSLFLFVLFLNSFSFSQYFSLSSYKINLVRHTTSLPSFNDHHDAFQTTCDRIWTETDRQTDKHTNRKKERETQERSDNWQWETNRKTDRYTDWQREERKCEKRASYSNQCSKRVTEWNEGMKKQAMISLQGMAEKGLWLQCNLVRTFLKFCKTFSGKVITNLQSTSEILLDSILFQHFKNDQRQWKN